MIIRNHEILEKLAEAPAAAVYRAYHKKNPDRLRAELRALTPPAPPSAPTPGGG